MTGVIQCFECHAGGHAAVTDHRDHAAPFTFDTCTGRHAGGGRDGRRRMADAEAVVFAFGAQAERRKTAESADRFELGAEPSADFVWVSMLAETPADAVGRRVETHRQSQRQQIGREYVSDSVGNYRLDPVGAVYLTKKN